MNRTLERIYLTLYWRLKAYGYPPPMAELAESCGTEQTTILNHLRELARTGYIKLYLYENGDYNVKFLIEPKREWVINIELNGAGQPRSIRSEIPVKIYVWSGRPEPMVYISQKELDKAELIKKGILV